MAIKSFVLACRLLGKRPEFWLAGVVAGLLASAIWLVFIFSGEFFAGRLVVLAGLAALFFITGIYGMIKGDETGLSPLFKNGIQYYFRVLLPQLVIIFGVVIIVALVAITLTLFGSAMDPVMIASMTIIFLIPTLLLTFFADTAGVFEDQKVFASIRRSTLLVSQNITRVIGFFLVSLLVTCAILFWLMIVWEALLYSQLEPITRYTTEQIEAITPDQLLALIGTDGVWVSAAMIFCAGLVLVPVLFSYKAIFFRTLAGSMIPAASTIPIQPATGEYDSKGRWYKY
jgi:hypothetical protein